MEGWVKRHVVVELQKVNYKVDHCTHHLHPPAVSRTHTPFVCSYVRAFLHILPYLLKFGGWGHGS